MSRSIKFSRPLFIYDDKCSACTDFAKRVSKWSKGWIRIAGHYYSQEAIDVKKMIFPSNYDPSKMSWLINNKGAFGARCAIVQVIKEIIVAHFKYRKNRQNNKNDENQTPTVCHYTEQLSCMSKKGTLVRIINTMRNCKVFRFTDNINNQIKQ